MLKGSNQQLCVEAAPMQHKLLLGCMVLLMERSGKSEVEETLLRHRHRQICTQLDAIELPALSAPEQNEAIARLCAARLLDGGASAGTLRLTIQADDVKTTVRGVELLNHLFPVQQGS